MDDEKLLNHLQTLEEDSASFTWGDLGGKREASMREYFRMPYGTEEEGLSAIVTSEVQDTIEWILPDLLDIFTSTDKAVVFDPTSEEDVKGAAQATDACNYIFYKKNNGFLVLYTAFKDAMMVKNCAVMWRKETQRLRSIVPVTGATMDELTMIVRDAGEGAEIESAQVMPPQPVMDQMTGQPAINPNTGMPAMQPERYNARVRKVEKKNCIRVEAFPPENLLIKRDWTSPLLDDCPYVCRVMTVSLSDLHEMGYKDVTAEDIRGSDDTGISADKSFRMNRAGTDNTLSVSTDMVDSDDDSLARGVLRIEYALVDYDGDGISERRCIYRLKDKILSNEECDSVPVATASPILTTHRWDGMSIAEMVSDLQQLRTDITRQMVDSGRLALNPRMKVLTDAEGSPLANIDDMLDSRAGGIMRQRDPNAIQEQTTPWVGGQMFPMLEYMDAMLTRRTGVSGQSQGVDVNALNRGGAYESRVMNAAQKRIKLIARVFAEILVKPIFKGVLKLLTEGDMEKVAFRLRNEFVQYDPMEWRDSYDMEVNVGLGTGDKEHQTAVLMGVSQQQAQIAMSPFGPLLIKPKNIYNTHARLLEYAGFKNVGDFYNDPGDKMPAPPPQQPPIQLQVEQMRLAADAQKFRAESHLKSENEQLKHQAKILETQAQLELQAANDARDAEREAMSAQHKEALEAMRIELERYKVDADNATRIAVAQIAHPASTDMPEEADDNESDDMQPMIHKIVRDENGKISGIVSVTAANHPAMGNEMMAN